MDTFQRIAAAVFVLYVIASFLPDSFAWGMNGAASLPLPIRVMVLIAIAPTIVGGWVPRIGGALLRGVERAARVRWNVIAGLVVVAGAASLLYAFRVHADLYGDTRALITFLETKRFTFADVLGFDDWEPLTRYLHQSIALISGLEYRTAYQLVSSLAGGVYVLLVAIFVSRLDGSPLIKGLLFVVGLSNGVNLLFFGHVEDYTLLYLFVSLYLFLGWLHFTAGSNPWWMLVVLVVGVKLHVQMSLLVPSFLLLMTHAYAGRDRRLVKAIAPGSVGIFVGISLLAAGAIYFVVLRASETTSDLQAVLLKQIFLPIVAHPTSLNGYTLHSVSHLNDVVQVLLMTVSPAVAAMLLTVAARRTHVRWASPRVLFFLLACLYPVLFVMTVNPILTPQRDWDFLAIAAGPIWMLAMVLFDEVMRSKPRGLSSPAVVLACVGLVMFSWMTFAVNSHGDYSNHRLRSLGIAAFRGYHLGSAYLINVGCKNIEDIHEEIQERKRILGVIEKDRTEPDRELGFLSMKLAESLYRIGDYSEAGRRIRSGLREIPESSDGLRLLGMILLKEGKYEESHRVLDLLNHAQNADDVQDAEALYVAEQAHYLAFLLSSGADSAQIEAVLGTIEWGGFK